MDRGERPKTNVICKVPNGVKLHLSERAPRDVELNLGEIRHVPVGEPVELRPGDNMVDEEFVRIWIAQNQNSDLLQNGLVRFPDLKRDERRDYRDQEEYRRSR